MRVSLFFKHKPYYIILTIIIILISNVSFTQYIGSDNPEDESQDEINKSYKKEVTRDGTLPPHIAFNLKAIKIPYMDNAIRISWNVNPNYDDVFILGRAGDVIDIRQRALSSKSITVITPRSKNIFVDDNMKPGKYYYVILSRDKIYNKDIELYKDVNYTSFPVIITPQKDISGYVRNIYTKKLSDSKILIGWDKINETKTIYSVYRSSNIIDSKDKLRRSKRISMVVDDNEFIDEKVEKTENYYYAITVKNILGIENFHLVPDQNYSTIKVRFEKDIVLSVKDIEAYQSGSDDIKIQWKIPDIGTGSKIKGYEIYRSGNIIDRSEKVYSAKLVATVDKNSKSFIDKHLEHGDYYYTVLVKFKDGITRLNLIKDVNYTVKPVKMSKRFRITSIKAVRNNNSVIVSWNYSGEIKNKFYRLYRTKKKIKKVRKLRRKYFLKTVNISGEKYTDNNPPGGKFYYILVPEKRDKKFRIISGITLTKGILKKEQTEIVESNSDEIDLILKKTFFKGHFKEAVKELNNFIKKADNERDVAKAQLFIGRVYVEVKQYKRAMGYFILRNVKKYYFDEARFWRDLTIVRLSN